MGKGLSAEKRKEERKKGRFEDSKKIKNPHALTQWIGGSISQSIQERTKTADGNDASTSTKLFTLHDTADTVNLIASESELVGTSRN